MRLRNVVNLRGLGKQFKPGCDAVARVRMINSNHEMAGFFSPSLRKKAPQCPK